MKKIIRYFENHFKQKLTVNGLKNDRPDIYDEIYQKAYKEGELSVHQIGIYAEDFKHYPNGEKLSSKVKNGEISVGEAAITAVKLQMKEEADKKEEVSKKSSNVIGFKPIK